MKMRSRLLLLAAGLALAAASQAQAESKPSARTPSAPAATTTAAPADPAANGIISNPEFEKAGEGAAQAWLQLLDHKDWGTAWDASSSVFRQNVPLGNWMDNVPRVREPYGTLVERQPGVPLYKKTLPGRPEGDYVTVVFLSKFANRQVEETVTTVRESDGRWRVTGYSPK